jgi:hypothetical protein
VAPTTCDSCGRDADEVLAVHRLYVTPGSWDTPAGVRRLEEVERWCVSCASQYPHEPAGSDPAAPEPEPGDGTPAQR